MLINNALDIKRNALSSSSADIPFSLWKQAEILLAILLTVSPLMENSVRFPIILIALFIRIKSFSKQSVPKEKIALFLVLVVCMSLSSLIDVGSAGTLSGYSILNVYFPICLTYGFVLSSFYHFDEVLYYVSNVALVGAVISIAGMLIVYFAPQLLSYFPYYTYGGYTHRTVGVFNVLYADGFLVYRNAGFAREPGVFQMLLNLAVVYVIRKRDATQLIKLIVLGVAIYLTKSTAGLAIFALLLLKTIREVPWAKFILLLLVVLFFSQLQDLYTDQVNAKLIGSDSFDKRFDPMINAYIEGSRYFFGMGNTAYSISYASMQLGSFDSFSQILLRYGYPTLVMVAVLYLNLGKRSLSAFVVLFVTSLSQNIWYEPLVAVLLFAALTINEPCVKTKRIGEAEAAA